MPRKTVDAFSLTAEHIHDLISTGEPYLPELESARRDIGALRRAPATQTALALSEDAMAGIAQIPPTTYTPFSLFVLTGDREQYEEPYFSKRYKLHAAALRLFLGDTSLRDLVQDYIWNICEETTWVLPAHMQRPIDLFSAETAYNLAETLALLGDTLDGDVRARVRREVERRIFEPYLHWHNIMGWYTGSNNWNGVCNSSVAATFLLLDPERKRAARAVQIALAGLKAFLDTAFEADGTSAEGVGYWGYGLLNFIPLAEMLRSISNGAIDLLSSKRMKQIAAYPAKVMLSAGRFSGFSDTHEDVNLSPGVVTRLQQRTGVDSLRELLAPPVHDESDWRLAIMLRNILWWDGQRPAEVHLKDEFLPTGAIARMVGSGPGAAPVVALIKAGHNAAPHNQNDIGSFMVHVDGESLLTDPGAGLYTRQYFGPNRYDNIFCGSYGHSVPRLGDVVQQYGREFEGTIKLIEPKHAVLELAKAYPVKGLKSLTRHVAMAADGAMTLSDEAVFSSAPLPLEEAFITWNEVEVQGKTAIIRGQKHSLRLTIETPAGAAFAVEHLEKESKENHKPAVLKRLSFDVPAAASVTARVRIQVLGGSGLSLDRL